MAIRGLLTPSILLVNEVVEERQRFATSLRAAGYHLIEAGTWGEAYRLALAQSPDIVVIDVHSAGSTGGIALTRRLKNHPHLTESRIIALSCGLQPRSGKIAHVVLRAGADKVLLKPVSARALKAEITALLMTSGWRVPEFARLRRVRMTRGNDGASASTTSRRPGERRERDDRLCPRCSSVLSYRLRWPVLSAEAANPADTKPRERLRYEPGWFCTSPWCDYREWVDGDGALD